MKGERDFQDLSVSLAGVKMRTPIGIGSVGTLMIDPAQLTPEMHVEVLLKHVEAGAGYICLPLSWHIPDDLLADLERRAKPFDSSTAAPEHLRMLFMDAETEIPAQGKEALYLYALPLLSPRKSAKRFQRETVKIIELLREKKPKDVPLIANVSGLGFRRLLWHQLKHMSKLE